jgi:hypothetical protein
VSRRGLTAVVSQTSVTTILNTTANCPCLDVGEHRQEDVIYAFAALRSECGALNTVLAPADAWSAMVTDAANPNAAVHRSYLLLALQRGCLDRVTRPVHRFLMRGQHVRPDVTKQYLEDLPERWLNKGDEMERHKRFRRFFGKIVELQVAQWLTDLGWAVTDLEALGHRCDIAGQSAAGVPHSIEVKYLGQTDDDFRLVLDSMKGDRQAGWLGVYGAINYLLFRAYEVAVSLRAEADSRMAILVVDAQTWPLIEVPLANGWVDWARPKFVPTEEAGWNRFLESQRQTRYPAIDSDLADLVGTLTRLWIVTLGNRFSYSIEREIGDG